MEHALTAFVGDRILASGAPAVIRDAIRSLQTSGISAQVLAFDDRTGRQTDVDMRDAPSLVPSAEPEAPRRGRPKLGVTAKEITLLPRHWDWLAGQKGGASVALRHLVEHAMRADAAPAERRRARDAAYHFLSAMAGNYPGFEAAIRALYAGDRQGFEAGMTDWPEAVVAYSNRLANEGWDEVS